MKELIIGSLNQTVGRFYDLLLQFLPRLLAMLIIVVAGWVIALILKYATPYVLALMGFHKLSENSGVSQLLRKADLPSPIELLRRLVFWVVWISFFLLGINALGIAALQAQISRFFLFLPQLFVALLVLFVGLLLANFLSRAALLAAVNANLPSARVISGFVRLIVTLLAIAMALEQIALAERTVLLAFAVSFGAIMLALAIAFGIGGRNVAQRLLERRFPEDEAAKDKEKEKHEEMSPL